MAGWNHELFGCLGNPSLSLLACLMMPLAVGKNAEFAGESSAVLWVIAVQIMPCLGGALLRGLIRKKQVCFNSLYISFFEPHRILNDARGTIKDLERFKLY